MMLGGAFTTTPLVGGLAVKVATPVPKDISVGPLPGPLLIGLGMTDSKRTTFTVQVRHCGNTLVPEGESSVLGIAWMSHVTPARDRHEQNLEAVLDSSGLVIYKTMRRIEAGEELHVWYGDTLARMHGIPVLTPSNIRGHQQYECTRCLKSYAYPNTLKAHLRFQCVSPISSPPFPLRLPLPTTPLGLLRSPPHFDVTPPKGELQKTITPRSAFTPPKSTSSAEMESDDIPAAQSEADSSTSPHNGAPPRAPVMKQAHGSGNGALYSPPDGMDPTNLRYYCDMYPRLAAAAAGAGAYNMLPPIPPTAYGSPFLPTTALLGYDWRPLMTSPPTPENPPSRDTSNSDTEQEQMTVPPATTLNIPLPSDKAGEPLDLLPRSLYMSRGRKGHWCIYCGKLYSRKYGLKIHLRTHTGYKPLKCKVCLRPFGDPSNLNKHVRLHAEGDTPYRCVHCGKVLVRRRDLDRHIRSRHPDVPCATDGSDPESAADDSAELIDVGTDFPEQQAPAEIAVS